MNNLTSTSASIEELDAGLDQETMADLKEQLTTLHKNLNTLREREAKYGGNAPLELVNQLDDHLTAIDLVNDALAGRLSLDELTDALDPLNLAVGAGINVGDIEGSFVAIGTGAKLIVNQALSAVEEAKKQRDQEQALLAEAVVNLAIRLQQVVAQKPKTATVTNPYKSLLDYRLEDAALFYGRSQAIKHVLACLERNPLTILHAESGAGKTSLLQAGLASRLLTTGDLPLHLRPWQVNPALAVKRAILPNLEQTPGLAGASLYDFLHRVTRVLGEGSHLYLFLDQFEEFFTQLDEENRRDFITQLAECLEDESLRVRWVLAMRKEYFGNLATFRPHIKNPFANDYLLRALNHQEATEVIVEPARQRDVAYEPALIQRLLVDLDTNLEHQSGELSPPHIQLVCSALFEQLQERLAADSSLPPVITLDMYEAEGGARGILRSHLNRVLKRNLSDKERELARQLLMALVSSDHRRIRRRHDELSTALALYLTSAQNLGVVLEELVEGRLVRVEEDEESRSAAYELAHDYLLTEIAVDPEVQAQKAAQELLEREVESFRRYKTVLSRDKYDIIHSQEAFLVLNDDAKELLRQSRAARHRWLRRVAVTAVVVIAILSLSTWWAITRSIEAEEARRIAEGRRVAAEALNVLPIDSELSLLLALEANQEAGDNLEIRDTLRQVLPTIRPWRPLSSGEADILAADWSANGHTIALALNNGQIQIWNAQTNTLLATLAGHANPVEDVRFNPQGTYLISTSRGDPPDEALRLWDVAQGKQVGRFKGVASQGVYRAVWSPDGTQLLTHETDKKIKLWDVDTQRLLATPKAAYNELWDLEWRPDGQKFASVGKAGQVLVWDAATMTIETRLSGHQGDVISLAWNAEGTRLATGGIDGTVRIWDTVEGHIVDVLIGHTSWVRSVTWHPNGRWLASSSDDSRVIVWDIKTGRPLTTLTGHTDWVWVTAWNPLNPGQLLTASLDGSARVWDIAASPAMVALTGHLGEVKDVAWNPAGATLASVGDDKLVHLWQVTANSAQANPEILARTLPGHTDIIQSVTWSPDGSKLATTSDDQTVRLWSAITLQSLAVLTGHTEVVYQTAWSPDGRILASGGRDKDIRLWDTATGQLKTTLSGHSRTVLGLAFSPDGATLASSSSDQTIILWDVATGKQRKTLTGHSDFVWSIAFSPDGRYLASASQDATARIWELATDKIIATLTHDKPVNSVAWNSDGSQLATASDDGSARIWDAQQHNVVATLTGHQGGVWSVAWQPGQNRLATASTDGVVRIFHADFQEVLDLAQANIHRQLSEAERTKFLNE